jgi:CheY-like chemotaxis protein
MGNEEVMSKQNFAISDKPTVEQTFTALIMDDQDFNRKIFHMTLEVAGYQIREAENGLHGLNILMHRTFDLLILDLAMPYIDGETVLKTIRSRPMHDKMCVVVVTANAHLADNEIYELADYVMHKPIDVVAFRNFVERLKVDPTAVYHPSF